MYYLAFLLVMATPLALLVIGLVWRSHPPKRDGSGLAYRTALSDRSDETWVFAHRHISRLWTRLGLLLAIVSAALMVVFRASYSGFCLWLIGGQMVFLCISAFLVEGLLKASFDENGNRIN